MCFRLLCHYLHHGGKNGLLTEMTELYRKVEYRDVDGQLDTVWIPPLVLADSAFGLEAWQMTPYKRDNGSGTGPERQFNWSHSSARVCVEHAFGRLKGRFRLLLQKHKTSWEMGAQSIMAAMVLHNFLGMEQDSFIVEWAEGVDELEETNAGHWTEQDAVEDRGTEPAMVIKQGLTMFLFQQGRRVRRERNR